MKEALPPPVRTAATLAVRYGVVGALAAAIGWAVFAPALFGARPTPQSPPDGYVSPDLSVRLAWAPAGDRPVRLEIATNRDFRSPTVRETLRSTSYAVPPLERGKTYYWRLEPGGVVATFRTSEHAVHF